MKTVNTHEAKTKLSQILSEVESGEEFILARAGKPIARLVPFQKPAAEGRPGKWRGRVYISEDFDHEDEHIRRLFESSST
ncbi:MAG: type II toxin-antitoxin system prevent-host-death family antitoxin [Spirochaetes bacterium]|jgi:prevent-host-death family protein|nr:type II toxin-antitoxin system prevent-host-death family antitoxin [Spirochaetota bacterium]